MENKAVPLTKSQEDIKTGTTPRFRFDEFEVDFEQRELRRNGARVSLQQKPFQILELLLEHRGELVSRSRLAKYLWPDLHVDFDGSLNTAVNALRQALHDSPQHSRFIETRPGLGYRFVGNVEILDGRAAVYDRKSAERIAESVIAAVAGVLNLPRGALQRRSSRFERATLPDREAQVDYRRGRYLLDRLNEQDLVRSQACFEAALARDPGSAIAHSGLADVCCVAAFLGISSPPEASRRAREHVAHALRADDNLPEVRCAAGFVSQVFDWDWIKAEAEYAQALELDDGHTRAHHLFAALLALTDRVPEALAEIGRAQDLDPISPAINLESAWIHHVAGDFDQAAAHAWKVLALEPRLAHAQYLLGLTYEQQNRLDDAITELENSQACLGNAPAIITALGHVKAQMGQSSAPAEALRELEGLAKRQYVGAFWRGILRTAEGAQDEALTALEYSYDQRDILLPWLGVDPRLSPLRTHPRFQTILHRVRGQVTG